MTWVAPLMSTSCSALSLQLLLRDAEGNVVEPAGGLSVPVTLPPAAGPGTQLGLSQGVLSAVLALAQRQGAFSMDISSSAVGWGWDQGCSHRPPLGLTPSPLLQVPNSIPLTTSALLSAFPQVSPLCSISDVCVSEAQIPAVPRL